MPHIQKFALSLLLICLSVVPCNSQNARNLSGTVTDKAGNVLPKVVVQLENTTTLLVQSYITEADGKYYFKELNPNVEFTVVAKYRNYWSKKSTLSKFNEAKNAVINLVINID